MFHIALRTMEDFDVAWEVLSYKRWYRSSAAEERAIAEDYLSEGYNTLLVAGPTSLFVVPDVAHLEYSPEPNTVFFGPVTTEALENWLLLHSL